MRQDKEPRDYYLGLWRGQRINRQVAEVAHPAAKAEIARLVDLGRVVEEVHQERPRVSTIFFNKPVDQIGQVPAIIRLLR